MLTRAVSLFTIKSADESARIIEGLASTPETDRMGDIVEPAGAAFKLPIPLLWQHRADQPIGHVIAATVTKAGIEIRAQIAPAGVLARIDEAWTLIRAGLVRGLSIGFRAVETAQIDGTFGQRFLRWEWLELSAVTIPANGGATIATIKSIAAQDLAALGTGQGLLHEGTPGVTGRVVTLARKGADAMKPIAERKAAFAAEKTAKVAKLNDLLGADDGSTLAPEKQAEFDTLTDEIKAIDSHLARLDTVEQMNKAAAVPVTGTSQAAASESRSGIITVRETLPPGIGLARAVMCKMAAFLELHKGNYVSAADIAKHRYPGDDRLHVHLRAAVPGGTTTETTWASPLVDPTNLTSEFVEFLRPMTIIGKMPGLKRVPFNVRITGQTSGGDGYWVGQGAPKPLTSFGFNAQTLTYAKVAAIAVITEELARFSSPSAEALVREALAGAVVERIDTDFVDPAKASSANVSPASITNGVTALSSAGTSADNARTDLMNLLEQFILANVNPSGLVLIMPNTLALALSIMRNSLGQQEFPGMTVTGGTLEGIPVIASQYAANQSGYGNMVIVAKANDIALADDGQVAVDISREASLQMLDNPTNNSSSATATTMVSMFQTNSIAIRAERWINWAKLRTSAVAYMDDVNWGSVGSPS
ncbi:MAG: phage major capsid protein [Betaproteobacteria bacterium]|nr:phage major capsid protein [Betaproteobacteria bacterium]